MANSNRIPRTHYTQKELLDLCIVQPNGCIEWQGNRNSGGYGRITVNKKLQFAHRYSLALAIGDNANLCALHSCDNPPCINPDHLRWGTIADNNSDAILRNRKSMPNGESHSKAKLKLEDVKYIRTFVDTPTNKKFLAAKFNVTPQLINAIMKNRIWKNGL